MRLAMRLPLLRFAHLFAALAALPVTACSDPADPQREDRTAADSGEPIVAIDGGLVRGVAGAEGFVFRGLPYAAPPTGPLRWQPPRRLAGWTGIRDATAFAPSCPQPITSTFTKGPFDEDCLYLNVYTPQLGHRSRRALPVLVWIHGGGFTVGAGRDYDPTRLAANGVVVVTINYRLGALGFLSHPALGSRRGEPSGNYGLMDQQATLRWVQDNIGRFGGDPQRITIAGESAGALSVLFHLVSRGSHGLFQRAIIESGSFAPAQQTLAAAESSGELFASAVHCPDQTAACLRAAPVGDIVAQAAPTYTPGTIDGRVLTESVGTALAAGRFAHVPILNGSNHDEEFLFVLGLSSVVARGTTVPLSRPVTSDNYRETIAFALGVSDARAAAIAAEYPLGAFAAAPLAFSALAGDASFACGAIQQDRLTARGAPTFAYEFNDDDVPPRVAPLPVATHLSELTYLFGQPDLPLQGPPSAAQEQLAARMRAAWASFAATGNPSTAALPWPVFDDAHVMSLVPPQPQNETDFVAKHHCAFWAAP